MTAQEKEKLFKQVVNYILTFDGIIDNPDDREYLATKCIEKFIPKKRQNLFSVNTNRYPMRVECMQTIDIPSNIYWKGRD